MAISTIGPDGLEKKAGTGPAFSALKTGGSTQAITSSTWTKVTFATEEFDTNNNFASSRFTPTVAGYYQITACGYIVSSGAGSNNYISLYKNGVLAFYSTGIVVSTTTAIPNTSALIYLNGSTDYVEVYAYSNGTSAAVVEAPAISYFQGVLVRAA